MRKRAEKELGHSEFTMERAGHVKKGGTLCLPKKHRAVVVADHAPAREARK